VWPHTRMTCKFMKHSIKKKKWLAQWLRPVILGRQRSEGLQLEASLRKKFGRPPYQPIKAGCNGTCLSSQPQRNENSRITVQAGLCIKVRHYWREKGQKGLVCSSSAPTYQAEASEFKTPVTPKKKKRKKRWHIGWEYSSEHLPAICEGLGSSPSTTKK
jgi:hypothetical protein